MLYVLLSSSEERFLSFLVFSPHLEADLLLHILKSFTETHYTNYFVERTYLLLIKEYLYRVDAHTPFLLVFTLPDKGLQHLEPLAPF